METTNQTELINQLSDEFSRLIVEYFTAEHLNEVIAKNHTKEYAGCCATHDYCDANEVMAEAFFNVTNVKLEDIDNDTEFKNWIDLWNIAWAQSKSKDFAVVPCMSDLDENGDIIPYSDAEAQKIASKITEDQIVKYAEFKTSIGTIKIVDRMPGHYKNIGIEEDGVKTVMLSEGMVLDAFGTGGYVDTVSEIVAFINENL